MEATHHLNVYFADPYSSWQRGSNENANGLLREFFPKGKDLAEVHDEDLARSLDLINNRPRKCLGWRTAHESFFRGTVALGLTIRHCNRSGLLKHHFSDYFLIFDTLPNSCCSYSPIILKKISFFKLN